MNISEVFEGNQTKIISMHSSAGILRITAISALAETVRSRGILLLDEIEDGIHPGLAATLVSELENIVGHGSGQILATTHSSVLLDYFPETAIIFLWRDRSGRVHNREMFANEEMKASLEYMYPGEIWLNMENEEIIEKLQGGDINMPSSNAFCVPGRNDNGSQDETDSRPRHAVVFPGFAGSGKSVSSSCPLSFLRDHKKR